jgi:protein SFI1
VQKQPKRALFEAYEEVFAESGLDTRQDRACLRILLQLGDPQIPGEFIEEKFEFLLQQMGINLSFTHDDPPAHNDNFQVVAKLREEEKVEKGASLQSSPKRLRRRASFTSVQDITTDQVRQSRPQRLSRASESRLQDERAAPSKLEQKNTSLYMLQEAKPTQQRRFSNDSPGTRRAGMKAFHDERFYASNHQSQGLAKARPRIGGQSHERFHQDEDSMDSASDASHSRLYPQELFYRPSSADLDRDAAAFGDMRLRNLQKSLLHRWARYAAEHSDHVHALELQAATKDFLTLKRQAFDFWRTAYEQKRQRFREERFFEHLHNRAGQAYDLYLLTKSFTHWIQITAAAVAKTNAARQRFLFTKYFNAWYQFTVTNELKAERHGLKAPLNLLRRRAAQYYHDQINALEVYHGNLTKYVFWRWFREWCDRAAPRYRDHQLQRRTLSKWVRKSRENRSREVKVDLQLVRSSLQKAFRTWTTKARIDIAGYHQADAFQMSHLLKMPLKQWYAEARLRPVEAKILNMRDWRIARSNFSIWQLRTRMVFRADAVNRKRILQNAYSAWNERLRLDALAARMNERIVAEALYKLVIAQRSLLMMRISEQHLKGNAMRCFLYGIRKKRKELSTREERWVSARKEQLLSSALTTWRQRANTIKGQSQTALEFYNPRLKQDTMQAIRLRLKEKQKLQTWATDARFYFLMTKYIAIWRAASAAKKKTHQRAAHALMRRKCKMNLARNVLYVWSHKQNASLEARKKSDEVYGQKIKSLQEVLFRKWQTSASQRKREEIQMTRRYDDRLLDHCLELLVDKSRHLYSLQSRAEQFHHLKISEICSTQLRRFGMRGFEMRRREQDADAMHDRHWNKHVRNIIRHWASKAQASVYREMVSNAPTEKPQEREPTDAGYGTASNEDNAQSTNDKDLATTRRAEAWTAFDTDLLERSEWGPPLDDDPVSSSTPVPAPGYLNTPSKRANRAKALASLSTTPATPLRTPFAARLRAGAGASPTLVKAASSRGGGLGFKSALGLNVENSGEAEDQSRF